MPIILLAFLPGESGCETSSSCCPAVVTGFLLYPLWHHSGYGPSVWPLGIARGWAHVFAIWDGARGKTMGWHPTRTPGSSLRRFRIGVTVWSGGAALALAGAGGLADGDPASTAQFAVLLCLRPGQPRRRRRVIFPGGGSRREVPSWWCWLASWPRRGGGSLHPSQLRIRQPAAAAHASLPPAPASYLGVYEPGRRPPTIRSQTSRRQQASSRTSSGTSAAGPSPSAPRSRSGFLVTA